MGGLGNGRRGGRSPPLMIGALIACILVLGFNYWVSSSRNQELQTKVYWLEGQVRRGTAERKAEETKRDECHEEISKQKEQIIRIENLYKTQLEGDQDMCSQEKGALQHNISSSTRTIQELKDQLNRLNDDLGKLQKELQGCQSNLNTLNKKLTYDTAQCNTQIMSQKEMCEERVAAAKLEVQKKMEKLVPLPGVSSQVSVVKEEGPVMTGLDANQTAPVQTNAPVLSLPKENESLELLTNEIIVDKGQDAPVILPSAKVVSKLDPESIPITATVKQDTLLPPEGAVRTEEDEAATSKLLKENLTENKDVEVMEDNQEGEQTEDADPGMEETVIGQGKADDDDDAPVGRKVEEPEDYDADEQIVGGLNLEKSQPNKDGENIDKEIEEELADYNGDDENEGEFEADKQAELAEI